jgi:hypothetical protein
MMNFPSGVFEDSVNIKTLLLSCNIFLRITLPFDQAHDSSCESLQMEDILVASPQAMFLVSLRNVWYPYDVRSI